MRYHFCPVCGKPLTEKEVGDEGMVPWCPGCERPWFDAFSTCVIALVVNDRGEAAVLRQNYISQRYGNLVSGYMKPGESAEESVCREVKEELGLTVDRLELVGTYGLPKRDLLMIGFFAHVTQTEFHLSGEVDGVAWMPVEEAQHQVHPKGSVSYSLIERYLAGGNA